MALGKLEFAQKFIRLDRRPISFEGRNYLPAIYAVDRGNIVIRASRQVEKSTFLANTIIHAACSNSDARILFVAPRLEQCRVFSRSRLLPMLRESPIIRRVLSKPNSRMGVTDFEFANGARLHVRPAFHTADGCRGLSANLLLVDEFQDVAAGHLPVLMETLSHAPNPRTILTGTPKLVDNQLEAYFNRSTANLWTMTCPQCQLGVTIDERCLGPVGIICPQCQSPLDASQGIWVPRNPGATWGQGFSISHPMVPWLAGRYDEILEKQRSYDPVKFRNEVLGLPTALGDHIVTRAQVEACCGTERMLRHGEHAGIGQRTPLFMGIDWGGGAHSRTVLVIASMAENLTLTVHEIIALEPREEPQYVLDEVTRCCQRYQVSAIAADGGGNGHVYNRLLFNNFQPTFGMFSILYSAADQAPARDGALMSWTVNRSASIGSLFAKIKAQQVIFPCRGDMEEYIDEYACEIAKYDDEQRTIIFTKADTQRDDALHATNYACLIARRAIDASQRYA
jgi:Phage terminase large subunit (GpA)